MVDTPQAFIMLTGPYRNIGDSLIRRRALTWARDYGRPVVLLSGTFSADWDESLEIEPSDQLVRSRGGWLRRVLRAPARSVLVIEPGEFNTDRRFYLSLAYVAVASIVLRLKGGRVVQMPRSLASRSKVGDFVYRTITAGGHLLWREALSAKHYRRGRVVPDIGFDHQEELDQTGRRSSLVVSLRGDRPMPGDDWVHGVRDFAAAAGLRILAMAQVEEDNDRTAELARALDGEADLWSAATSSADRERDVRAIYKECRVVLSDRLHALVIGAVSGATPIEIVPSPSGKARNHFRVIGLNDVSHDARGLSRHQVASLLGAAHAAAVEVAEHVSAAAAELLAVRRDGQQALGSHGSR